MDDDESVTICTPTHSTDPGASTSSSVLSTGDGRPRPPPVGGITYMIRDLDSGRILTLERGKLVLKREASTNGGWRWECTEDPYGFLGFREMVSYRYLGRDNRVGYCVDATLFEPAGTYWPCHVKEGGYILMGRGISLRNRMGIAKKGQSLVQVTAAAEAARWEFIEV